MHDYYFERLSLQRKWKTFQWDEDEACGWHIENMIYSASGSQVWKRQVCCVLGAIVYLHAWLPAYTRGSRGHVTWSTLPQEMIGCCSCGYCWPVVGWFVLSQVYGGSSGYIPGDKNFLKNTQASLTQHM